MAKEQVIDDGLIDKTKDDKAQALARKARERDLGDIRYLLKEPEGRRFYWRVLSKCGVFHSSWTGDPHQTLVNEGKRTIGILFLDDLLEANPSSFAQMQRENKSNIEPKE